jgi:CelD/BcsL family acetyltransferase involved in cellulose biosynthesis
MRVELVTERSHLPPIAGRWDELALADSRDGFFRTSAWYSSWMEHIRPDAEPFVIIVKDRSGNIVGLAPLCRLQYRDLGFRLTAIGWAGREVVSGDFLGIVSDGEHKARVTSLVLDFVVRVRGKWGALVMGELIDDSDSCRAVEQFGKEQGFALRRQEERICPYISLPATFEAYLMSLGSSSRYNIRRRIREVIDKKKAVVRVYSRPEDLVRHLPTLIELHVARWRKDNLPGTLSRNGVLPFLNTVCSTLPPAAGCRLYVLEHEDRPVAAILMFHFGCSAVYYQAGWDPASPLATNGAALVLMALTIRDSIEQGFQYYEFLRGDEAYKTRWTKTYRSTVTVLLARSAMARVYLRATSFKDFVKKAFTEKTREPDEKVAVDGPDATPVGCTGLGREGL